MNPEQMKNLDRDLREYESQANSEEWRAYLRNMVYRREQQKREKAEEMRGGFEPWPISY